MADERESNVTGGMGFACRLAWVVLRLAAVVLLGTTSSTFVYQGF
jgi:hypothetical protein